MQATRPNPASSLSGNVIPAQQIHFVKPVEKKAAPVAVAKPIEPAPAPPPAPPIRHQPQVTLIKDGDTVTGIEVLCTCGEVIRLDCEYGT